jgi:hypothetical protein
MRSIWRSALAVGLAGIMAPLNAQLAKNPNDNKSTGVVVVLPPPGNRGDGLEPGAVHLPGLEYRSGTGWWALACGARCELHALKMDVKPQPHPQYDGDPVPGQLLRFTPTPPPGTLAMFKPFRAPATGLVLKAGPVVSWHQGLSGPTSGLKRSTRTPGTMEGELQLPSGEVLRVVPVLLTLGKAQPEQDNGDEPRGRLTIELQLGGRRQLLDSLPYGGVEGLPTYKPAELVRWVGDLDGDGEPDLIVDTGGGGWHLVLYLSSLAAPGGIVGEAGRFDYFPIDVAGC